MSADDDTFDIDIYGDDTQEEPVQPDSMPPPSQTQNDQVDDENFGDTGDTTNQTYPQDEPGTAQATAGREDHNATPNAPQENLQTEATTSTPQQGTKRKAPSDSYEEEQEHDYNPSYPAVDSSLDPSATPALKFADLHWWTTEEDLRAFSLKAGVEEGLKEVSFGEHKINGKSKGEAYMEFASPYAAAATKREAEKERDGAERKAAWSVHFTQVGNPFFTPLGAVGGGVGAKNDSSRPQQQNSGAYNNSGRGGFQSRGGYGGGGRGGGFQNQNRGRGVWNNYSNAGTYNQPSQHQSNGGGGGGWGMNGGYGGYGANPMMANMGGMGMGMNRGNMMGGMGVGMGMNRGGGAMMPNMMGNMMNRGGAMMGGMGMAGMMGRGGWGGGGFQQQGGGGMQQGYGGVGFQGGSPSPVPGTQQQQGNKRPRME